MPRPDIKWLEFDHPEDPRRIEISGIKSAEGEVVHFREGRVKPRCL